VLADIVARYDTTLGTALGIVDHAEDWVPRE